jgi:hypothetical protein
LKKLVAKFGIHNVIAVIIMAVGVLLFVFTPLFLWLFEFDSDIFGVLVFIVGLVMFITGLIIKLIRGKNPAAN